MEDIMSRLKNWFIQQEWKVIINPDKSVKLSSAFTKRYSTMDAEYFTFLKTINEHKSETIVKMHKRELSDHSQKGRLFPAILGKVKNK